MDDFYSDLKSILGPRMLWEVVLGIRRNDLLGLAGQLAYFFLLFFFPFLIFLVSLTGLVIGNPEAGLKSLFEALTGLLPANAQTLVVDYVDRIDAYRKHRRTCPRYPWRPVAGPGRLHLHHQGGEPLLPPPGEPAVLAVARHVSAHNLGFYATRRGTHPRGVQRRSLPLGYSRSAAKRHEPREALELGDGLRCHHCGPRCALLPGPRREATVQVDHAGRVHRDSAAVRI